MASLGPQSQAPATQIRSGPKRSIMSTARAADTFVRAQLRSLHTEWTNEEVRREIVRRRLGKRF